MKSDGAYADATGISSFEGATATSQLGTVWYDTCLPQVPGVEVLPAQESVPAMLVALDSGAVDLVVTDQPLSLIHIFLLSWRWTAESGDPPPTFLVCQFLFLP